MKENLVPLIVILFSALILILIWFGNGLQKGVAEGGLPFYDISRSESFTRDSWMEFGFGIHTSNLPATWPTYWFLSNLERIGLPSVFVQALLFYFFLAVSGVSIYFLTKLFFPNISQIPALVSVYAYWFNPLAVVNIWNRFLYDFIFLYAFLPLLLTIFLLGIKRKNNIYAVIFGLTSILYSFSFAAIATTLFLWIILGITTFYFILDKGYGRFIVIKYFILSTLSFVVVNAWWIIQIVNLGSSADFKRAVSLFATPYGNFDSLNSISAALGKFSYLYRFLHGSFYDGSGSWAVAFTNPVAIFIELLITLAVIFGVIIYRKNSRVLFLGILFFAGIFLMKGTAHPFGEIFESIFTYFTPFQLFRNPFEKFSLLVVISSSLILAFVTFKLGSRIGKISHYLFYVCTLALLIMFWGYPLISNRVFFYNEVWNKDKTTSYDVKVPQFYKDASSWLLSQPGEFLYIAFPLGDEGITYSWEFPYRGVELSYMLLFSPGLSNSTTIPFYNFITEGLEKTFFEGSNFPKVMNAINAKYVLLRKDVNWKVERMRDPQVIQKILESSENFKKVAEFGELSFWENKQWKERFIYVANTYIYNLPISNPLIVGYSDLEDSVVVETKTPGVIDTILSPSSRFHFSTALDPTFDMDPNFFPHVNNLPSSFKYPLTVLKEKLTLYTKKILVERLETELSYLGKRLVEARISKDSGDISSIGEELEIYINDLNTFEDGLNTLNTPGIAKTAWQQEVLANVFAKHQKVLQELESLSAKALEAKELLLHMEKRTKILPENDLVTKDGYQIQKRNIYQFDVPETGKYSIMINSQDWQKYFSENLTTLQVDNNLYSLSKFNHALEASLGTYQFEKGIHEIGYNTPEQVNLVEVPEVLNLEVDHGVKEARFNISNFNSNFNYEVSFDYFIRMGNGFEISFEADNEPLDDNRKVTYYSESITPDSYFFDQQSFGTQVSPNPNSTNAEFVIKVKPGNDCESIYYSSGRERCDNSDFRAKYDKTTKVVIKDIQVRRMLDAIPVLKLAGVAEDNKKLPNVKYEKMSLTMYKVNIRGAEDEFMLVLSQLFNSGWKVKFADGLSGSNNHLLVNGFANGWLINKQGDFDLTIEYEPQKHLNLGKKISLLGITIGVVISFVYFIRKKNEAN